MPEPQKHEKYKALIERCKGLAPVRTAVVHPCSWRAIARLEEGLMPGSQAAANQE
jgi:hypothetical protein